MSNLSEAATAFIGEHADRIARHGTAEWYAARTATIGASVSPCLFGHHTRRNSPVKQAAVMRGLEAAEDDSELMEWGHDSEEPLIKRYNRDNEKGRRAELFGWMYRSKKWPWLSATCDGVETGGDLAEKIGAVECKLLIYSASEWEEGVPDPVLIQAQHQMAVTGCRGNTVIGLLDGYRPRWTGILRDESFIENQLVPITQEFYEKVKSGADIEVDGSEATYETLKRLHPDDDGSSVTLSDELWEAHLDLHAAKTRQKEAKALERLARNRIVAAIGDATFGQFRSGETYSYKTVAVAAHQRKASKSRRLLLIGDKPSVAAYRDHKESR